MSPFELYNPSFELIPEHTKDRVLVYPLLTVLLRDGLAHATTSIDRFGVATMDTGEPPSTPSEGEALDVVSDEQAWRLTSQEGWTPTGRTLATRNDDAEERERDD